MAEADTLKLDVGRNLSVASIQDTEVADGQRRDLSGKVTVGGGASISASYGKGETDGNKAWVAEQTRLIGRSEVDIQVEEHTQIDGALIANIDKDGIDPGNLKLDTGTLAFNDIHDVHEETSYYLNVSVNVDRSNNSVSGWNASGYHSDTDRTQINRATLGNGTITIRDKQTDLASLNRDVAQAQQILKDKESNTTLYVSDSSIDAIANYDKTWDRWVTDAKNYHINTLETLKNLGTGANMGGMPSMH